MVKGRGLGGESLLAGCGRSGRGAKDQKKEGRGNSKSERRKWTIRGTDTGYPRNECFLEPAQVVGRAFACLESIRAGKKGESQQNFLERNRPSLRSDKSEGRSEEEQGHDVKKKKSVGFGRALFQWIEKKREQG